MGRKALAWRPALLDRMVKEGGMPNLGTGSQQAFVAGRLGATMRSTAVLRNIIAAVGRNFTLQTTGMPVIDAGAWPTADRRSGRDRSPPVTRRSARRRGSSSASRQARKARPPW